MGNSDIIGDCATLAALLEVSAYPKPGNVHRTRDFEGTMYEHFLGGSVSLGTHMRKVAERSEVADKTRGDWSKLGLGSFIHNSVKGMLSWQSGGNVHLGIILLFTPIAAAAGAVMRDGVCDLGELRRALNEIIYNGTPEDSVNIYKAIDLSMSRENLGDVSKMDVKNTSSIDMIREDALTPLDIFKLCQDRDTICREWVTNFKITFTEGHPHLTEQLENKASINNGVLSTFINILSKHPDSLIQRKNGYKKAEEVRKKADGINREKDNVEKQRMIEALDKELSEEKGKHNPGTTADLTAASIFLLLLTGWRP